jgi:hypothetical protein
MYRIQEKPNNANLSEITNTAYIFFDWNPAIVTNTTYNVNTWVEGVEELSNNVKLYPNPSNTYFSVDAKAPFEYQLEDLSGRTVLQGSATSAEKIALQSLMCGPYLLKVRIGNETFCTKLIKE